MDEQASPAEESALPGLLLDEDVRRLVIALQRFGGASSDLPALHQLLVDLAPWVAGADGATVERVEDSGLVSTNASGFLTAGVGTRVERNASLSGLAATTGEPQVCCDTSRDPRVDAATCRRLGVGAMIVIPFRPAPDAVAVLKVATREVGGVDERHVALLEPLTQMAAARLEHVAAFQAQVAADQGLARVSEASRDILMADEPGLALCEWACRLAGAPVAFLLEPDPAGNLVITAQAGMPLPGDLCLPPDERSIMRRAFDSGKLQLVADFRDHPDASRRVVEMLDAAGLTTSRSGAAIPLLSADTRVGVLALVLSDRITAGHASLVGLVNMLAAEAGVAIERNHLERRLEQQARTDDLTGLPNRRVWQERMDHEMARAARNRAPLCLVILDLDHFKQYNDTHGHVAGDEALRAAAAAWSTQIRETDLLARLGGEEFALLLPETSADAGAMIAERLLRAMPTGLTASAGLAEWTGEDANVLYRRADVALYAAKAAGRNQLCRAADAPSGEQ